MSAIPIDQPKWMGTDLLNEVISSVSLNRNDVTTFRFIEDFDEIRDFLKTYPLRVCDLDERTVMFTPTIFLKNGKADPLVSKYSKYEAYIGNPETLILSNRIDFDFVVFTMFADRDPSLTFFARGLYTDSIGYTVRYTILMRDYNYQKYIENEKSER